MDFLYTVDPNANEPIMLIDSHIGFDTEDGEGIMGDKFSRELMFLDTLGKNKIHIWINSPGGVVTDGQQIYGTILKTKTKIDTHNIGIAASIAGPIFLAGRTRYMMDYAKLMMHPVSGGDAKTRAALEDSIVTMLSSRSDISEELIKQLMAKTTWINAEDCRNMGLCEVENSSSLNIPRVSSNDWKDYKKITNKLVSDIKPKIKNMNKVTNKLGLNEAASEDNILSAIESLENKVSSSEAKVSNAKKELDEAEARYNELKAKFDKVDNENKVAAEAAAKVANENANNKAKELVSNAVKIGKITNDIKVIENWEKQAVANFASTEELINSIPVNKTGAKISAAVTATNDQLLTNVIANTMAEVRNNLKIN